MVLKSFALLPLALPLALSGLTLSTAVSPTIAQPSDGSASNGVVSKSVEQVVGIVRIDGSANMSKVNDAFQAAFEQIHPNATVISATNGARSALRSLREGRVDVVALGRALTQEEAAAGFVAIPVQQEKIILVVSGQNRFTGSLTTDEFAKIFRGEITNWSEVNGPNLPIRFIDHPEDSDMRLALSRYPAFRAAPFRNGFTTVRLADSRPESIAQELGKDGLSYAVLSEAERIPQALAVPMHQTLPGDPRYPLSQVYSYVYRQGALSPAGRAFIQNLQRPEALANLKYTIPATAKVLLPNQQATTALMSESTQAVAQATAEASRVTDNHSNYPQLRDWWWLLLMPVAIGIAWAMLKSSRKESPAPSDVSSDAATPPRPSGDTLTPYPAKDSIPVAESNEQAGGSTAATTIADSEADQGAPANDFNGNPATNSQDVAIAASHTAMAEAETRDASVVNAEPLDFPVTQLPANDHPPMPTEETDIPFGPGRDAAARATNSFPDTNIDTVTTVPTP